MVDQNNPRISSVRPPGRLYPHLLALAPQYESGQIVRHLFSRKRKGLYGQYEVPYL